MLKLKYFIALFILIQGHLWAQVNVFHNSVGTTQTSSQKSFQLTTLDFGPSINKVNPLQSWNAYSPFGISNLMQGPTVAQCSTGSSSLGKVSDPLISAADVAALESRSPANTRDDEGFPLTDNVYEPGTHHMDVGEIVEGMDGMMQALKRNVYRYCESTDYSSSDCTQRSSATSLGRCWKYVKMAMVDSGMVDSYWDLSSESAYDAYDKGILEKQGFCKLDITNSNQAPVGSIMIYSWTREKSSRAPRHGHIEVKTGENEYISDYISNKPIDQKSDLREFTAAYVPGPCDD